MGISKINLDGCNIDQTDGIGILVTGEAEISMRNTNVTRSTVANIIVDQSQVQIERVRSQEFARAFARAVQKGATERDLKSEFGAEFEKRGFDFDKHLSRAGSLAQLASVVLQVFGG